MNDDAKFETLAVRTQMEQTQRKEHSTPLYLTSSFTFDSYEEGAGLFNYEIKRHIYSRSSNPNNSEFAEKLALLEGAEAGMATSTGMAAIFTVFMAMLKAGDHIVAAGAIYRNTMKVIKDVLGKFGVTYTFVDVEDNQAWEAAIQPNTRMLFLESPTNPALRLADLRFVSALAQSAGARLLVDNTFATPYLQNPIKHGAHLVIHSGTKYLDGQGRMMGGAILGSAEDVEACRDIMRRTGPSLSPFNAWMLSKSLETLSLRMERHCSNALQLCGFLQEHPDVDFVRYPFLESHPQYALAKAQMRLGGGMVACQIAGGKARGARFLDALRMLSRTGNLGDSRTIVTHPASTTHAALPEAVQREMGVTPGFIRFSVGLEHLDDIIHDIEQALRASQ